MGKIALNFFGPQTMSAKIYFMYAVKEKGGEKLGLETEEEGGRWILGRVGLVRNQGGGEERGRMKRA